MSLRCYLLLGMIFTSIMNYCCAQRTSKEYIVTDSTLTMGNVIPLGPGEIQFKLSKKDSPVSYTAAEIKEYGYGGKVYESVFVNGSKQFLKKLVSGKTELYQGKRFYALKVDSTLIPFTRTNYRSVLRESLLCEGKDKSLSKIAYAKNSLSNHVADVNNATCNQDQFPYVKFGVFAGYNFLEVNASFGSEIKLADKLSVPTLSLFTDIPVFRPRSLFVTAELNWFYAQPLFYRERGANTNFSGLNVNAFNLLIGGKLLLFPSKIKPYFKTSALFSRVDISSPTGLVETKSDGVTVEAYQKEIRKADAFFYGFNSGLAFEIPLGKRKNFHIEAKYLKSFNGKFDFGSMNFSGFSTMMGFNF